MKALVLAIRWVIPVAVGAVLAATAVVYAGTPDFSGVIHGCYKKASPNQGMLRVIDTEKGQTCLSSETPLTWNAQGPAGHIRRHSSGVSGREEATERRVVPRQLPDDHRS